MARLQGRRVFVTGGANGIGAAIVRSFVREGAHVVIADLDRVAGTELANGIKAIAVALDVTDLDAVGSAIATHGPFDILVNNAGIDQHALAQADRGQSGSCVRLHARRAACHAGG